MIDFSYYEAIGNGNIDFLKDILLTFQLEIPVFMSELKEALYDNDIEKIKKLIHKIKPAWMAMGLPVEPFEAILQEVSARAGETMDNLENIVTLALEDVKTKLAQLDGGVDK